jgi:hypothetical protein
LFDVIAGASGLPLAASVVAATAAPLASDSAKLERRAGAFEHGHGDTLTDRRR